MSQLPFDGRQFRKRLLNWFDDHHRDLPWRRRRTRYRIWVSEVMLQQTQVATVIDYFNRFMKRFPNVRRLADADEAEVLKCWEGLGYYRRARQMHRAAQKIVEYHRGKFPGKYDEVLALPGIGRYTAGAILSIADDQPLPILEGNTQRVYSRLINFPDDVTTSTGQSKLWTFAERLITRHRPGDLNQALMELGSEICLPRMPLCRECPVRSDCQAFLDGDPQALPNKGKQRMTYQNVHQVAVVIRRRGRVALRRCQPGEHWAGLWDFPRCTVENGKPEQTAAQAVERLTGLKVQLDRPFRQLKHSVTRFRITLDCYEATRVKGRLKRSDELRWKEVAGLDDVAMSTTGRKIARDLRASN